MDQFCKNPTYENYKSLPNKYKYALFSSKVNVTKEISNILLYFLYKERKEEEMSLFDFCYDLLEESYDIINIFSDPINEEDVFLFSMYVEKDGTIIFESATEFPQLDHGQKTDVKEVGRKRFEEIIKHVVIGKIIFFKNGTDTDGVLVYNKKYGRHPDDSKDFKVPKVYRQDKEYILYAKRYGFYFGNILYEHYSNSKQLTFKLDDTKSRLKEYKLGRTILNYINAPIDIYFVEEIKGDAEDIEKSRFIMRRLPIEKKTSEKFRRKNGIAVKISLHGKTYTFMDIDDMKFLLDGNEILLSTEDDIDGFVFGDIDFSFIISSMKSLYNYYGTYYYKE